MLEYRNGSFVGFVFPAIHSFSKHVDYRLRELDCLRASLGCQYDFDTFTIGDEQDFLDATLGQRVLVGVFEYPFRESMSLVMGFRHGKAHDINFP